MEANRDKSIHWVAGKVRLEHVAYSTPWCTRGSACLTGFPLVPPTFMQSGTEEPLWAELYPWHQFQVTGIGPLAPCVTSAAGWQERADATLLWWRRPSIFSDSSTLPYLTCTTLWPLALWNHLSETQASPALLLLSSPAGEAGFQLLPDSPISWDALATPSYQWAPLSAWDFVSSPPLLSCLGSPFLVTNSSPFNLKV